MRDVPGYPDRIVSKVARKDRNKSEVLRRYYTEMAGCLAEWCRWTSNYGLGFDKYWMIV